MDYHKYIFDGKTRAYKGNFEEMYQNEDKEGYDSWNQDKKDDIHKSLALSILSFYRFNTILDLGCGKGAFTKRLSGLGRKVTGVDISATAIEKARRRFPKTPFLCLDAQDPRLYTREVYDLIVLSELLPYVSDWAGLLDTIASHTKYVFTSTYIPPDSLSFLKDIKDLRRVLFNLFDTEIDLEDGARYHHLFLGRTKRENKL